MLPASDALLFESHGYTLQVLYVKLAPQAFTQWGYLVQHPDQTSAAFKDKVQALQYLDQVLNHEQSVTPQTSPAEKILQEDMTTALSTSSLITTD